MRIVMDLLYRSYGGVGLGLTRNDVMAMSLRECLWWEKEYPERMQQQKEAIERAQPKK